MARLQGQLQGQPIDGDLLEFEEWVIVGHRPGDGQKHAVALRQHIRLVAKGDALSTLRPRQFKGEANNPLGGGLRHDPQALHHTRNHHMFQARIQAFGVFPHHHQIDILVGNVDPGQRAHRPKAGIQLQFLPHAHIDGPVPFADRGGTRAFERNPMAANQIQCCRGQRIAMPFQGGQPGVRFDPVDVGPRGAQNFPRGRHHLRTNAVSCDHDDRRHHSSNSKC